MGIFDGMDGRQKVAMGGLIAATVLGAGWIGQRHLDAPTVDPTKLAGQPAPQPAPAPRDEPARLFGQAEPAPRTETLGGNRAPARPAYGSVSLNRAGQAELETLPRVGPAIAKRILDYRAQNGGFKTIDELENVKGIGPKTMAQIRPYVRL